MEAADPATGKPLPADCIQRVLFIASSVHVYNIPPMVPGKGHVAATWTEDGNKRQIFTARLRIIETAIPLADGEEKVKTDIVLEDPKDGQLFAAAPYLAQAVVEPVADSSRFFVLRVQDEAGRKASLGIGFEERPESFDFSVALQEARKTLGWDGNATPRGKKPGFGRNASAEKRDYSLKEGETITVKLPGRADRRRPEAESCSNQPLSAFSLPPPPSSAATGTSRLDGIPLHGSGSIPKTSRPRDASGQAASAEELGFDDGKFGEFA